MNFNKIYKGIIICICILSTSFITSTYVYGISDLNTKELIPINMQKVVDGASVDMNENKTNGYELDVKMNTKGLNQGYYTTYLYENQGQDWSDYDAMRFQIDNDSDIPMRINLNVKKSDDKVVSPSDENMILISKENSELMEIVHPSYGTIELPAYFKGTINIPFKNLIEKDNSNVTKTEISKILSWGIIATLPENAEQHFKLSNFELVKKGSEMEKYFNSNFSIKGDNTVEIPVAGEAISEYKIDGISEKDNINKTDVKFKIINNIDGISINDDGRLTVNSEVDVQKVEICAVIDNSISENMEIKLVKSWTLSAQEVDGTSKSIPKPNEMAPILKNDEIFFLKGNFIIGIRIVIVIISVAFVGIYLWWNKKKNG